MQHAREVNTEALATFFLQSRTIKEKMRGLGFDGAMNMSGKKVVSSSYWYQVLSAMYVHCRCHQLQLACLKDADEYLDVNPLTADHTKLLGFFYKFCLFLYYF